MTNRTILDSDLKEILSKVEGRYHVRLPRRVLMVDYGEHNDLYIRFKHAEKPTGEPSKDGLVVFFYEERGGRPVAVEVLDLGQLLEE